MSRQLFKYRKHSCLSFTIYVIVSLGSSSRFWVGGCGLRPFFVPGCLQADKTGGWKFTVTLRPPSGPRVFAVRFASRFRQSEHVAEDLHNPGLLDEVTSVPPSISFL